MKSLYTYRPKDAKSRNFACGLMAALTKKKIKYDSKLVCGGNRSILVENITPEIESLYLEYQQKIIDQRNQFAKAIKINYKHNQSYKIDFLYRKLLYTTINGSIYLPQSWLGGKSIQNYEQNDFYTFNHVQISHSKQLDGERVIVKTLSKKSVWILPKDFYNHIDGLFEDLQNTGVYIKTMIEFLDRLAFFKFEGSQWEQFIQSKKIFEL